jgi:hypothetical protein
VHDRSLLGYFISFSTYGSRVRGDARGSVDRRFNSPGEPFILANPMREDSQRDMLALPPFRLNYGLTPALSRHPSPLRWRGGLMYKSEPFIESCQGCGQSASNEAK